MLQVYVLFLCAVHFLSIGFTIGKKGDLLPQVIAFAIYIPVFGRVLGWF